MNYLIRLFFLVHLFNCVAFHVWSRMVIFFLRHTKKDFVMQKSKENPGDNKEHTLLSMKCLNDGTPVAREDAFPVLASITKVIYGLVDRIMEVTSNPFVLPGNNNGY